METSFRRIDANRFTAVVYRDGKAVSRGKVVLGGMFGRGMTYSMDDRAPDNSYNEMLGAGADDQGLHLKVGGMSDLRGSGRGHLTSEGAAEVFWSLLIERLQGD
ncbi:hypothetical protein [Methylobacterium durans]|uniref:hypothetical protein n=1 Tax=Methylobacterium durans TaxID=2202825 RepID=UPI001F2D60A0|nr:hypothetical protein [Methylobacterium durans]